MKTKTKTAATKIRAIAEKHADEGWTFYARYSGRGMFGDTCPGIVCPGYDVQKVEAAARKIGVRNPSVDGMGLDRIVYWSSVASD